MTGCRQMLEKHALKTSQITNQCLSEHTQNLATDIKPVMFQMMMGFRAS